MTIHLKRAGPFVWEIPRTGRMKVPGRVYLSERQVEAMGDDPALTQVANVAHLPGILGHSLAMPDIHWGYGFPIGGVAAVDAVDGGVSPGGVGFDINCLAGETEVLLPHGGRRRIVDLVHSSIDESVVLYDPEQERLVSAPVGAGIERTPSRPVLRMTHDGGGSLTATEDHPILTPEGMRPLGRLAPGDRVACVPFEGVSWEPPDSETLADATAIREVALSLGKTNAGRALDQVIRGLDSLLPLTGDHPALPAILKAAGYILGDGTVYFGRGSGKGNVAVYGRPEDLEDLRQDLSPWVGVSRIYVRERAHAVPTAYGTVRFAGKEHVVNIRSTGFALLLVALGIPHGPKASQDFTLPRWLHARPLWQQRLFLAGFFGAELTTPDAFESRPQNFKVPVLHMVKREGFEDSGWTFLADVARVLRRFGVGALTISDRVERENAHGGNSIRLRLVLSGRLDDLHALWSRVGFEYNRKRRLEAAHASGYLAYKRWWTSRRIAAWDEILALRTAHGWGAKRIVEALGASAAAVNFRFVERTIHGGAERMPRTGSGFPGFETWRREAAAGLGDSGAVWHRVVDVRPATAERVYDLSIDHPAHDFVAGGVIVHNCGVRLVTTALAREEVQPRIGEVVKALYKAVPTGVGSGAGAGRLGRDELRRVLRQGARWATGRGFVAGEGDPERCEEGGALEGADPAAVSERALERGSTQLGSLGSGNHFLEVQVVDEIFDAEAAEAFGLVPGGIVVMIHSGSRGLGHQVCDETVATLARRLSSFGPDYAALPDRQLACAPIRSDEGRRYLGAMKAAANFAWANRQVMTGLAMEAMANALGVGRDRLGARLLYDVCHNIAKFETHEVDGVSRRVLVHRKGATRAFGPGDDRVPEPYRAVGQPVIIPGDMARYSFVLAGNPAAMTETFGSSCHGAGRLLSRTQARKATRGRKLHEELLREGVTVMSRGYKTLAEEVPEAYKDVADVTAVVEGAGLSRRVARLKPIGCIKG